MRQLRGEGQQGGEPLQPQTNLKQIVRRKQRQRTHGQWARCFCTWQRKADMTGKAAGWFSWHKVQEINKKGLD
jgi:hypothetical protein